MRRRSVWSGSGPSCPLCAMAILIRPKQASWCIFMGDKRFYFLGWPSLPARLVFGIALAIGILVGSVSTKAQNARPGADPVITAFNQAMRESRYEDAEKILTDAIPDLEQTHPNSLQLANYLDRLSAAMEKRGNHREAGAVRARAAEIYRIVSGLDGIEVAGILDEKARTAQRQGDLQEAERLMLQATENARSNMTRLKSGREVDIAAGTFGTLASLYIDQSR